MQASALRLQPSSCFIGELATSVSPRAANLELKPIPLTSYVGFERSPALSPDGKQVAFSWDGERQDNPDIYVKLLDTANPVRLTTDPGLDDMPVSAPDGRKIAFVRTDKLRRRATIRVVPALGGPERELAELAPGDVTDMELCHGLRMGSGWPSLIKANRVTRSCCIWCLRKPERKEKSRP